MKGRLTRLLAAMSLVLCLATAWLWWRSYSVRHIIGFGRAGGNCHTIQSLLGRVHILSNLDGGCEGGVSHFSDRLSTNHVWNAANAQWSGGMSSYPWQPEWHCGFIFQTYTRSTMFYTEDMPPITRHMRLIVVPYWFPTVLFAIGPIVWLATYARRRRRRDANLCVKCGYDLRATPDRCPECGTPVAAVPADAAR